MKTIHTPLLIFACCAALLTLAGCATTRVDVDVYKGPLADHADIQTERLAVMAIGAKPLLVALRDQLEWPNDALRKRVQNTNNCRWYKSGYIEPRLQWLEHEDARRVNGVLYLYERKTEADTRAGRKAKFARAAGEALRKFHKSVEAGKADEQALCDTRTAALDYLEALGNISAESPELERKQAEAARDLLKQVAPGTDASKLESVSPLAVGWDAVRKGVEGQRIVTTNLAEGRMDRDLRLMESGAEGLERGRLEVGLEDEIDEYLEAMYANPDRTSTTGTDGFKEKQKLLMEDLVRFAEKLLFIANNGDLIQQSHGNPPGNMAARRNHENYIRILQAVGNSILVQADELREREAQGQTIKDARGRERRGLKRASISDPLHVLAGITSGISARRDAAQQEEAQLNGAREPLVNKLSDVQKELDALNPNPPAAGVTPSAGPPAPATGAASGGESPEDKKARLGREKKRLHDEITKLDAQIKQADAIRVRLDGVLPLIASAKASVEKELSENGQEMTGPNAFAKVAAALDEAAKAAKPEEKIKYSEAIAEVNNSGPPKDYDFSDTTGATSSKDVLDELVATLRNEHVIAVRNYGASSVEAQRIAAALEAAYAHRSGMVYIRPASAYLRTSYPATTLQGKPNIGWENMLAGHAWRNMPLVGEWWENNRQGLGCETGPMISEIDKQFWQTINSVRVSGAGNTNYVIAKDDIGNWYVKNYSADPKPIIEGAQSLAMFSLGGAAHTDVLNRLKAGGGKTLAPGAPEASQSVYAKLLRKYQTDYVSSTKEDVTSLAQLLDPKSDKDADAYKCSLAESVSTALKGIGSLKPDTGQPSEAVFAALKSAAQAHLLKAYKDLTKGLVDTDKVKSIVNTITSLLGKDTNPATKVLMDMCLKQFDNPVALNALVTRAVEQVNLSGNKALQNEFDKLKKYIGDPDPAAKIIDALQAMRQFHNQLAAAIAGADFTSTAQTAVASAQTEVDARRGALNALPAEDAGRKDAEAKLKEASDALTVKQTALAGAKADQVAARSAVTSNVRAKLIGCLDKRLATVKTLEQALATLGDITSQ